MSLCQALATPTKHQAIHRYPTRRPAEVCGEGSSTVAPSLAQAAVTLQALHMLIRLLLLQLEAPPVDQAEYTAYRTATDLREPYRSARSIL